MHLIIFTNSIRKTFINTKYFRSGCGPQTKLELLIHKATSQMNYDIRYHFIMLICPKSQAMITALTQAFGIDEHFILVSQTVRNFTNRVVFHFSDHHCRQLRLYQFPFPFFDQNIRLASDERRCCGRKSR